MTDTLQNAIATTPAAPMVANAAPSSVGKLGEMYRMAKVFSGSQLIPKHMQGKPDDCFIAIVMADQMNENALMVMQNIVIVSGTAGWKATFVIARANRLGPFVGPIEFRTDGKGDALAVTAYATVRATNRAVERTVSMSMAKAAGWTTSKKYQEIPEQMLSYRAACFLVRLYCPEVLLGMRTDDELHDMRGGASDEPSGAIAAINAAITVEKVAEPESDEPTAEEMRKAGAM